MLSDVVAFGDARRPKNIGVKNFIDVDFRYLEFMARFQVVGCIRGRVMHADRIRCEVDFR